MENFTNNSTVAQDCLTEYFKANAKSRFSTEIKKYIWFKCGKFLNPTMKNRYINEFIQQESENFINKGEINIPFLEFRLSIPHTYKCLSCNVYKPAFNTANLIQINFNQFKMQFDEICNSVTSIRNLIFINPIRNTDFPQILEYTARNPKVHLIKIMPSELTNLSEALIDVLKKYNQKVYFHINENDLFAEEFKISLKANNIKYQIGVIV